MYAAGFTWRGQTRFYHIPENSKMNAEVFIHQVLRPMMLKDVPKLYGKDAKKVKALGLRNQSQVYEDSGVVERTSNQVYNQRTMAAEFA